MVITVISIVRKGMWFNEVAVREMLLLSKQPSSWFSDLICKRSPSLFIRSAFLNSFKFKLCATSVSTSISHF